MNSLEHAVWDTHSRARAIAKYSFQVKLRLAAKRQPTAHQVGELHAQLIQLAEAITRIRKLLPTANGRHPGG